MPSYRTQVVLPPERDIPARRDVQDRFQGGGLYFKPMVTTERFDRVDSIMHHLRPPTRITQVASTA